MHFREFDFVAMSISNVPNSGGVGKVKRAKVTDGRRILELSSRHAETAKLAGQSGVEVVKIEPQSRKGRSRVTFRCEYITTALGSLELEFTRAPRRPGPAAAVGIVACYRVVAPLGHIADHIEQSEIIGAKPSGGLA